MPPPSPLLYRRPRLPRPVSPDPSSDDAPPLGPHPPLSTSPDPTDPSSPAPTPARRGRKPGPLSRSARETQRKLNHSIIEKARRTKINEALATLRQLVPADYPYPKKYSDKRGNDDDDILDDTDDKPKPKKQGKREEKEKEFKLEILVRTVSFMEELLDRVHDLEARVALAESNTNTPQPCPTCQSKDSSPKRTHRECDDGTDDPRSAKRINISPTTSDSRPLPSQINYTGSRLPSISSWLPEVHTDPTLHSPSFRHHHHHHHHSHHPSRPISHLPSPPASTHVAPIQTSQLPPTLNLGPMAMSALLSPHSPNQHRTAEDESAASSLLQFSSAVSPLLPPTLPPASAAFDTSRMRTSCITPVVHPPDPGVPSARRSMMMGSSPKAQTPGSMLGMRVRR